MPTGLCANNDQLIKTAHTQRGHHQSVPLRNVCVPGFVIEWVTKVYVSQPLPNALLKKSVLSVDR